MQDTSWLLFNFEFEKLDYFPFDFLVLPKVKKKFYPKTNIQL